jgi:SAM-dependent methyltransferase
MGTYIYDPAWEKERERLRGLEEQMDPGSILALEEVGITTGWRCLEVGAGGGSIAEWMCDRVAPGGSVVATDLDTRFLDAIERPNLSVRTHNIVSDPPIEGPFDLVHSRAMLAHVPERYAAVANMASSVRPGAWVVIEDVDFSTLGPALHDDASERLFAGFSAMMRDGGIDPYCGRELPAMLRRAGLTEVWAEGKVRVNPGGVKVGVLTLESLGPRAVAGGYVSQEDLDAATARVEDPELDLISPVMFIARGRKPAG